MKHPFTHAAEALEFTAVLDVIASGCVNAGAKQLVRRLRPGVDEAWIEESMRQIMEVCEYQQVEGRLSIIDTAYQTWIERAVDRSDVITPVGLQSLAAAERSLIEFKRKLEKETGCQRLQTVVSRLHAHKDLIESIDRVLDTEGAIKDNASPALAKLRKSIARTRGELRRLGESLAKKHGSVEYATFTGSRYMLLVPRGQFKRKDGIVHSTSQTGQSLYYEPLTLVEKNNTLETVLVDEQAEVARILAALTREIVRHKDTLLKNIQTWETLDALNAKASFAARFACVVPAVSSRGTVRLVGARHPLLQLSLSENERDGEVVPLTVEIEPGSRIVVITGPNAGGKTVALKTVGLLTLMFQSGLPVPCAEGSELGVFGEVFADIGDEQSISSSLSTFTSHLRHLDVMCREADAQTLCLIDEIGDGTDPDEGAALAIATLERLLECRAAVIATTHYGKVKAFALEREGVSNASMVFDDDKNEPLYELLQGTAGRSRGIETARRVGFYAPVVKSAETLVGEDAFRMEKLLSDLEANRLALERERTAPEAQSDALNRLGESYAQKERDLREFEKAHKDKAKREAGEILIEARREIEAIVKSIRENKADKTVIRKGRDRIKQQIEKNREAPELQQAVDVATGDHVSLSPSGVPGGRVLEVVKDSVIVEINGIKIRVKKSNLYKVEEPVSDARPSTVGVDVGVEQMETTTVDVRGHDRAEALEMVDRFVDRAVLSGLHEIKIIHGVGEGILVRAIREYLRDDPRIKKSRPGGPAEGGAGVSFAELK